MQQISEYAPPKSLIQANDSSLFVGSIPPPAANVRRYADTLFEIPPVGFRKQARQRFHDLARAMSQHFLPVWLLL